MVRHSLSLLKGFALVAVGLTTVLAAGCGSGGNANAPAATTAAPSTNAAPGAAPAGGRVLPVTANPITNTSTEAGLTITKALVENNVAADTGKAVDDHLEVELKNTSTTPLDDVSIYYTITDPASGASESYYAELTGFTIAPGASRIAHFDASSAADHYPVNKYSLYYTDKNALTVDVTASSPTTKPATFTVHKDAGGAEAGVE